MKTALLYVHGKGGAATEGERYKQLFHTFGVFGIDYKASTPREAGKEIRENPIKWDAPTHILYGEKDALISFEAVKAFAEKHNARFPHKEKLKFPGQLFG